MKLALNSLLVSLSAVLSGCFSPSEYVYLNIDYARTGHFRGGELRIKVNGERPDFFGNEVSRISPDAFGATDQAMIQKLLKEGENTFEVEFVPPKQPPAGEPGQEAFTYSIAIQRVKKGEAVDSSAQGNLFHHDGEIKPGEVPKPLHATFTFAASK